MSELRLKIRNKIYTSGKYIVDTKNNNSYGVVVYLGNLASENFKEYIDSFLKDTLRCQIAEDRITIVQVDSESIGKLSDVLCDAVKNINFSSMVKNELHISFVTVMDDELYACTPKIDISLIEGLKKKHIRWLFC